MTDAAPILDLQYTTTADGPLALDIHRPEDDGPVPVVLYFHGGGWTFGDKADRVAERLLPVVRRGIAVASVQYRLTGTATWPAQVEDAKAAARFLRANGAQYGLATKRIGAWGASAGGHLALMLGLTGEGDDAVQAVCDFFAPVDALRPNQAAAEAFPRPAWLSGPIPGPTFDARLLGVEDTADAPPELVRSASPIQQVADAPAGVRYLLMHGDRDGLVSHLDSVQLHAALAERGLDSQLLLLGGANHEGVEFDTPAMASAVAGFFLDALA